MGSTTFDWFHVPMLRLFNHDHRGLLCLEDRLSPGSRQDGENPDPVTSPAGRNFLYLTTNNFMTSFLFDRLREQYVTKTVETKERFTCIVIIQLQISDRGVWRLSRESGRGCHSQISIRCSLINIFLKVMPKYHFRIISSTK